jgi:ferredoxin-NADP reductase
VTYTATLASIHRMTPNVKQFRLVVDDHEFDYRPGQHTTVHMPDGDDEAVRPYTPTSLPGTNQLTLMIKRYDDGTVSVYMHDRDPGDEIEIGDVEGNLYLRELDRDVAFVATGTGITPMIAMLKHYLRDGSGDAHFFFGEKDREHVMYRETLDQLEAENENLSVTYSLSEPDTDWNGPSGHVQEHLFERLDDAAGTDFYVCGVPEMVVETEDLIVDRGVPEERVFIEGWEGDEVSE